MSPPSGNEEDEGKSKITHVYLPSAEHGWLPALQLKVFDNKATVAVPKFRKENDLLTCSRTDRWHYYYQDNQIIDLADFPNNVLPMQNVDHNGNLVEYKDMVELPFMHEAAILYNLKYRHKNERPYTRTGDILIAVNPYQWITDLYSEEKRTYYSNRLVWDNNEEQDPRSTLQPHVYEVSALSYKGLTSGDGMDQSILVSGESGAGKTETVKICLNHIASVQRGQVVPGYYNDDDQVDNNPTVQKVVESNPLLEAFGNAKTRRNDNSSRFGKYLQLQFDKSRVSNSLGIKSAHCSLVGSKCDVYLLEKNRVCQHDTAERTFHIFYQLLAAPDRVKLQFWDKLRGTTKESFKYVGFTPTDVIEGMTDGERFDETMDALELVGIVGDKLTTLIRAICVVMQLGNLAFGALNGDTDKSTITTTQALQDLADLMGVCPKDLTLALTERTFKTRNESHKVPLNAAAAKDACDALAKEAYQKVFLWLVRTINESTTAPEGHKYGTIGLLDIFGFEVFAVNRFEQLCINYANEKLQQKFTEDIFVSVKAEYESEGIGLEDIYYDDNTDVLDLIEGNTGLLALLNEECVRPKGNDFEYVQKVLQINSKSPCLMVHRTDRMSFGINHYAGPVVYDGDMFVQSNLDTLPIDLENCVEKCSNAILSEPRKLLEEATKKKSRRARSGLPSVRSNIVAPTVWTKYRSQLSDLMRDLRKTQSRYIRCIKPNSEKKPLIMEHNAVIEQLRCAGVVAGITIARSVFPNRLPNTLVLARFSSMGAGHVSSTSDSSMTPEEKRCADCKSLLNFALKEKETRDDKGRVVKAFVVGKTKTYFRAGALEWLEAHRVRNLDVIAVIIQKAARGWLARNKGEKKRQKQRMAELEAERRKQESIIREAQLKREAAERRAQNLKKQQKYIAEIECLERALARQKLEGTQKVRDAHERVEVAREELDELKEELEEELNLQKREVRATKARQEARLQEATRLIEYLKKENKRARKTQAKTEGKLEEVTEASERLSDSMANLEYSVSNVEEGSMRAEAKHNRLSTQHNEYKVKNKELQVKVMKLQDNYMEQAEARLELQKTLGRILTIVQEQCRDADLVEEAVVLALGAETEAKSIMMELDTATTDPLIIDNEASENYELEFSEHE